LISERGPAVAGHAPDNDLVATSVAPTSKSPGIALSVVIPVGREEPDLDQTHRAYQAVIEGLGGSYEIIYVLQGGLPDNLATLRALKDADPRIVVLMLGGQGGEAAALASGYEEARGATILTLPRHLQVDPADIPKVLAALEDCDMAVGQRSAISSGLGQRVAAGAFHWVLKLLFGHPLSDLVCRVRACRRAVLDEISVYGVQNYGSYWYPGGLDLQVIPQ